jgi:hypothetical protein
VEVQNVGLPQQVAAIYQRDVNSGNVLIQRWPNAAAGVSITAGTTPAFSAWTQLVAASKIANPAWMLGASLENLAAVGASEVWLVDLATGASGSEVSLSSGTNTAQGFGTISYQFVSGVGVAFNTGFVALPIPIRVNGSPRVSGAVAGLVTGGKAAAVGFIIATGVGT